MNGLTPELIIAFGGLATVIGVLWRKMTTANDEQKADAADKYKTVEKKLEKCETQHDEANEKNKTLEIKVAGIEGQMSGYTKAKDELKEIANRLISEN